MNENEMNERLDTLAEMIVNRNRTVVADADRYRVLRFFAHELFSLWGELSTFVDEVENTEE